MEVPFKGVIPKGGFGVSAVLPTSGTQTYIKNDNFEFVVPVSDWRSVTRPSETTLSGDVR